MHSWGKRLGPVVAVAVAVALPLTAAPSGAALSGAALSGAALSGAAPKGGDGRASLWESDWVTEGYPEEDDYLWYQTPETVLDPATGDVFATVTSQYVDGIGYELRRIDGSTGRIELERTLRVTRDLPETAPGSSQQLTRIADRHDGEVWASAIDFDGTPLWRRTLTTRGQVRSTHTHPVSGTTCAVIQVRPRHSHTGTLTCVSPSGEVLVERTLKEPGLSQVTADPRRSRWYVATMHTAAIRHSKKRREITKVRAFDADGTQVWARTQRSTRPKDGDVWLTLALTVDPRRGRVALGSSDSRSTRVSVWKRNGRKLPGRTWSVAEDLEIQDVVFAGDGSRIFVVHSDQADHIDLVALRPNGRKLWQRPHSRSAHDAAYFGVTLVPAADRRRVLLVGEDVAAYDWTGKRRWRGRTSSDFLGSRGHYDQQRGRFIVPWTDQGYPKAAVSAFRP